ncbi:MAG: DUF6465 family protein [Lachnospiraceae bacterium]|nr:DUF6465 family protein [Lachnospiraceae bacterium]
MAITKRAVAPATTEKPADGVVKINSVEEPKAKQKAEASAKAVDTKKPVSDEKKAEPAKKPAAKKTEAKKPAAKKPAEKKAEAKKPAAKKPAEKKAEPAKKPAAKKPAAKKAEPAKKPAAKKAEASKTVLTVQYNGRDITKESIDQAFEGVWTYDMGRKMAEVKSVNFYFKPEDSLVYFVTNDGTEGKFEI